MERDTQDMEAFYSRLVKEELRYFEDSHELDAVRVLRHKGYWYVSFV